MTCGSYYWRPYHRLEEQYSLSTFLEAAGTVTRRWHGGGNLSADGWRTSGPLAAYRRGATRTPGPDCRAK